MPPKRFYPEGWDAGFVGTDFTVSDASDVRRISVMYHTRASMGSVNAVRQNRKIQRALTKLYAAFKGYLVRINPHKYMDRLTADLVVPFNRRWWSQMMVARRQYRAEQINI